MGLFPSRKTLWHFRHPVRTRPTRKPLVRSLAALWSDGTRSVRVAWLWWCDLLVAGHLPPPLPATTPFWTPQPISSTRENPAIQGVLRRFAAYIQRVPFSRTPLSTPYPGGLRQSPTVERGPPRSSP